MFEVISKTEFYGRIKYNRNFLLPGDIVFIYESGNIFKKTFVRNVIETFQKMKDHAEQHIHKSKSFSMCRFVHCSILNEQYEFIEALSTGVTTTGFYKFLEKQDTSDLYIFRSEDYRFIQTMLFYGKIFVQAKIPYPNLLKSFKSLIHESFPNDGGHSNFVIQQKPLSEYTIQEKLRQLPSSVNCSSLIAYAFNSAYFYMRKLGLLSPYMGQWIKSLNLSPMELFHILKNNENEGRRIYGFERDFRLFRTVQHIPFYSHVFTVEYGL